MCHRGRENTSGKKGAGGCFWFHNRFVQVKLLAYYKYSDTIPSRFENESSVLGPVSPCSSPVYHPFQVSGKFGCV